MPMRDCWNDQAHLALPSYTDPAFQTAETGAAKYIIHGASIVCRHKR